MEFRVLGPVEVWGDDGPIALGGPQQRRLAAALATDVGQALSADRLVDVLWNDGDAPEGARRSVMTYVSRLRSALGDVLVTGPEGYALERDRIDLDADEFTRLVAQARGVPPEQAVRLLGSAVGMWRGRAFGELGDEWWARPVAARLDEARLAAYEELIDARLVLGGHGDAISDLEGLVRANPQRERFARQFAVALYRADRQPEAIRELHRFREGLVDATGLDPSEEFVELERQILERDPALILPGGRPLRSYRLSEVIGQGAYGTVYRATQSGIGREVAIKVLRAEYADAPEFVRQFEAEARLMARLEDPRIVPLYDFWREPGSACLVMRLMRGGSAQDVLARDGALALDRVTSVVDRIGGAVHTAHLADLVHGDVKPANVLFDDRGDAYLADFGIARAESDVATLDLAPSPLYASPEVLRDGPATARSDQYSFAATIWELLAGIAPFSDARSAAGDTAAHPLPLLRSLRTDVPDEVDVILQRATAPEPADRFASVAEFVEAWRAVEGPDSAGRREPGVTVAAPNPYTGLRAFREADASRFFGRERLVDELAGLVDTTRFVTVVGASGSGKSSLVFAGLVPRLRRDARRYVATMAPGSDPFAAVEAALASVAVGERDALSAWLVHDRGLLDVASHALPTPGAELVLMVDQLEELWTLTEDPDLRSRFCRLLANAATATDSNVRVVATLRADLFDRPLEDAAIGPLIARDNLVVTAMNGAELERAITEPALGAGVSVEGGLVAELVAFVAREPGSLPLLQFVLSELYERREGMVMTAASYREFGGIGRALARRADELVDALDEDAQVYARLLFTRLVHLGDGGDVSTRRVSQRELATIPEALIDAFVAARLLVLDREPRTRERTIAIAHEALLRYWPRLSMWLDEDRDRLRVLAHVTGAATAWDARSRDPADLYRGSRLDAALELADAPVGVLAPTELEFVEASRAARDADAARQLRETRRFRRLSAALAIILVVALLAGLLALVQRRDARNEATRAERAGYDAETRRLISTAEALATSDPPVSYLLAVEAGRRAGGDRIDASGALQRVLTANPGYLGSFPVVGQYTFDRTGKTFTARTANGLLTYDVATRRLIAQREVPAQRGVSGGQIAVTRDNVLVESDGGNELRFWTPRLEPRGSARTPGPVNAIAANADVIATGHAGGLIVVFDARTHVERRRFRAPNDVFWLDVSRDGETLAALVNPAGAVHVWRVDTGEPAGPVLSAPQALNVSLSPDGSHLASIPPTQAPRVFDVASGAMVELNGVPGTFVRFVDSTHIAITTEAEVLLVDSRSGAIAVRVATPCSCDFAVSPDGNLVATGLSYPSLFALDGRELLAEPLASADAFGAYFAQVGASDDGRFVSSSAGGLRVWDRRAGAKRVVDEPERQGEVDSSGRVINYDGMSGTATITDASTGTTTGSLQLGGVPAVFALSPDGRFMATASYDSTIAVYDVETGDLVVELRELAEAGAGNDFGILIPPAISFSPDGKWLTSANWTAAAIAWDTTTWKVARRLVDSQIDLNGSSAPVFDPSGRRLAAFTERGTIGLFGADDLAPAGEIPIREQGIVYQMAFSPDGSLLAAVIERRIVVFDVASRRRIGGSFPVTLANNVRIAGKPPVMVAGLGRHLMLWNLDLRKWSEIACTAAGRNLTTEEWEEIGPRDTPYHATCAQFPAPAQLPGLAAAPPGSRVADDQPLPPVSRAEEDAATARALERAKLPARFGRSLHPVGAGSAICPGVDPARAVTGSVTVRGSTAQVFSGPVLTVSVLESTAPRPGDVSRSIADAAAAGCVDGTDVVPIPGVQYTGDRTGVVAQQWLELASTTFVTTVLVPVRDAVVITQWRSTVSVPAQADINEVVDSIAAALESP